MNSNEKCRSCGKTWGWHEEHQHQIIHAFTTEKHDPAIFSKSQRKDTPRRDATPPSVGVVPLPFDPVLRSLLIEKGLITVDDLTEAERKLRVVSGQLTGIINKEMSDGSTS